MSILETKTNTPGCSELQRAIDIQLYCAKLGFDWPNVPPVFDKVIEEIEEIQEALANPNKNHKDVEDEMGDLFFACINLSRHLNVNPSNALKHASDKFVARFHAIEAHLQAKGEYVEQKSLDELEALWIKAKSKHI